MEPLFGHRTKIDHKSQYFGDISPFYALVYSIRYILNSNRRLIMAIGLTGAVIHSNVPKSDRSGTRAYALTREIGCTDEKMLYLCLISYWFGVLRARSDATSHATRWLRWRSCLSPRAHKPNCIVHV